MFRGFLQFISLLGAAALAVVIFSAVSESRLQEIAYVRPAAPSLPAATTTEESVEEIAASEAEVIEPAKEIVTKPAEETQPAAAAQSQETEDGNLARRTQNPYSFAPKTEGELYTSARGAIVNIFCETRGPLSSISGSGVVIDPRGVILTNAHVAQYLLLASDPQVALRCFIRTGSPAQNRYTADILYIPSAWVDEHAKDIAESHAKGTGERDYALLLITKTVDGSPLPSSFSYLPSDTREAIAFSDDSVLLAGYPAEFTGGAGARTALYPTSVFTRVGQLLTFGESSVDLISLGGAVIAQSGSSGGAVINMWGQLVGIISTTSEGATTAERELRAITVAYIDRDIISDTGSGLAAMLSGDISTQASRFMQNEAPALAQKIIGYLP